MRQGALLLPILTAPRGSRAEIPARSGPPRTRHGTGLAMMHGMTQTASPQHVQPVTPVSP